MSVNRTVVYPEERLPWPQTVGLGLQHVLAMFGATVLAPLLMHFDPNLAVFFSGIGTLLFMLVVRGKIPSYLGSSFAFIGPVLAAQGHGGVPAALGGIVAAGLVYLIVGLLVKTNKGVSIISMLMPPPVTAAVICVIGIGLAPVAWNNASKNWPLALITLSAAIIVAVGTRGFTRLIPVLIGVAVGYGVAVFWGLVDFSNVAQAAWIGIPNFVTPTFNVEAVTLILPVVVLLIAENLGHVKAVSAYMDRDLTPQLGDAFVGDGLATFLAGMFGGTGVTTYAENIGNMAMTRVFSNWPLRVAAVTAILLGLIPKFGELIHTIPDPVMGGITIVLFGLIAGASTKVIAASVKTEDWGGIDSFGVFGMSVAVCAALLVVFNTNAAINAVDAAKQLPTTLRIGIIELDAIGASTFFAILLNLAMVLLKRFSPFSEKPVQEPVEEVVNVTTPA